MCGTNRFLLYTTATKTKVMFLVVSPSYISIVYGITTTRQLFRTIYWYICQLQLG